MSKLAVMAVAAGALALTLVALAPSSAEAGWRRGYGWSGGWGGPGVGVYVGPRYGWYGSRRYWRPRYPAGYPYAYYPYWRYRNGW
jgi:hypothetical protein